MFDTVIVLDDLADLCCPHGHTLRSFQTKDLDEPSMNTYLVQGALLYLALRSGFGGSRDDEGAWCLRGDEAILEQRFKLRAFAEPRTARIYTHCAQCEPILVRTDTPSFHDILSEHQLFVDFVLKFHPGEPVTLERTSGTRDDIKTDLRRRGLVVLDEDEPLAVAHREVKRVRGESGRRDYW